MNRKLAPSLQSQLNLLSHRRKINIGGRRRFFTNSKTRRPLQQGSFTKSNSTELYLRQSSSSTSVSSDEISKFSLMASTWWEPDQNPLISMNPTRMEFIVKTLQTSNRLQVHERDLDAYQPLIGLKALDIGCGGGLLSESLARLGAQVTAIDPSEEVAKAAYEHSQLDPTIADMIDYRGGTSVEDLAKEFSENVSRRSSSNDNNHDSPLFDVICILEVIEHAIDPRSLIESAASLLRKPSEENPNGGMLFVSTINRTVKSYAIAIVGGEYVTGKLPVGTHSWSQFKSPQEVHSLVGNYGLREANLSGMVLKPPFFDLRWELNTSDTDINWIGAYCHQTQTD